MVKVTVPIGDKVVVLKFGEFTDEINVDELTSIDYSNLYGEAVTISALMNRIGLLKAEAESALAIKKLECEIYAANMARQYRREANINSGKFTMMDGTQPISIKLTEDSLSQAILCDATYQNKKKAVINAQRDVSFLDSLYWSVKSKDTKLSVLMPQVTPAEFYDEIVAGTVNGILIAKPTDNWTSNKK